VMCTSEYKRKADGNIGGVGRETQQYKHYLSDPDQEHVIPVIIEEGEISGMIPSVFPKNPLCIDLSASTDFEQSFQQLVSILQGVRPVRPPFSELHSLLQCSRADFSGFEEFRPGIQDDITTGIAKRAFVLAKEIVKFSDESPYWFDASSDMELLSGISDNVIEFSNALTNKDAAIDLLSVLWRINTNISEHEIASRIAQHAIDIGESDKDNPNYGMRYLHLCYQKAMSLHSIGNLDKALDLYNVLVANQENCMALHPAMALEVMLCKGNIHHLKKQLRFAIEIYEHVIDEVDRISILGVGGQVLKFRACRASRAAAHSIGEEVLEMKYKDLQASIIRDIPELPHVTDSAELSIGITDENQFYPPNRVRTMVAVRGH